MQEKQEETQQNCARGSCSKGFKTMCGGQALIEGIMMRGPKKESVVVRRPDGGLEIQERELRFIRDRYPVLGWPLIRGVVNFGGSMYSGVKALMYSAEFFPRGRGGGRGGAPPSSRYGWRAGWAARRRPPFS